ncbi:MAG: cell shape determination protein CcmA [Ignavibacteriae bacterium]|nr:MAG: cell shape determination protein CcmA [Ignavibacteriota bacterium]
MGKKENSYSEDVSILSDGVNIEGKLSSYGNVRIDGTIVGDVTVKGNLTLGPSSDIKGKIIAKNLNVNGKVEGTLNVEEKLTLEASSKIKADITAKTLIIEEGAKFDGNSSMSQASTQSFPNLNKVETKK